MEHIELGVYSSAYETDKEPGKGSPTYQPAELRASDAPESATTSVHGHGQDTDPLRNINETHLAPVDRGFAAWANVSNTVDISCNAMLSGFYSSSRPSSSKSSSGDSLTPPVCFSQLT